MAESTPTGELAVYHSVCNYRHTAKPEILEKVFVVDLQVLVWDTDCSTDGGLALFHTLPPGQSEVKPLRRALAERERE